MKGNYSRLFGLGRLRRTSAFTLVELLIVLVVVGVLIAVAAPSFLGQTQKAHDSVAKQYLTVAYKAATAWAVDHTGGTADASCITSAELAQGSYCNVAGVVGVIPAFEPGLTATAGTGSCATDVTSDPKHIVVEIAAGGNLTLCNDPTVRVCRLMLVNYALQPITCGDEVRGSGSVVTESTISLTTSGGLITDATRATNTSGDGLGADSSFGVWEASTNEVTNGGFETNLTGWWNNGSGATLARGSVLEYLSMPVRSALRVSFEHLFHPSFEG
ncbi:MAG: prepilin-type N-terminal cleavage/methylation domain-containing protein [Actinobacteria bacterium]|nr:prepilin-type N-terminal cleavage/methylation domain-containing protein [Actinomycetota bacterium]